MINNIRPVPKLLLTLAIGAFLATGDVGNAALPNGNIGPVLPAAAASAPAVSSLGQSLLARRAFEETGLKVIGVATFGQKPSCFVRLPGSQTPQVFEQGDAVGEFRVAAIEADAVSFEHDGVRFRMPLGADSDDSQKSLKSDGAAMPALDADPDAVNLDPAQMIQQAIDDLNAPKQLAAKGVKPDAIKSLGADLKSRTSNFKTASIIKDAWDPSLSKRPASISIASADLSSFTPASDVHVRDGNVPGDASPHPGGNPDFAYPIKGRMTSEFGYRRYPLGGGSRMHNGLDLAAPTGTTIYAAADGVVSQVGYNSGLGRFVFIRHINGFETRYGHMSAQLVQEGQTIKQGEPIGREGSTGESTGPHLHFEIRQEGRPLNPLYYLGN